MRPNLPSTCQVFPPVRNLSRRRGISLLEVLISMFILLVGLAGIASLLPAGRSEIMSGVKLDYAMMLGRNAFRELKSRGYLKPPPTASATPFADGWFEVATTPTFRKVWRPDLNASLPFDLSVVGPTAAPAIVIDPLGAYAGYDSQFPQLPVGTVGPFLRRVTPLGDQNGTNQKLLAESIFRCPDDLYVIPNTITKKDPPQQQIVSNKRLSAGSYSWIATIVPDPTTSAVGTKVCVSVAVMYKRDLSFPGAGENNCRVIALPGSGLSGGEVLLYDPITPLVKPVRPGQWIMLAGEVPTGTLKHFRWYRVVAANPITEINQSDPTKAVPGLTVPGDLQNSSIKVQLVTLAGGDWSVFPPAGTNFNTPPPGTILWPTAFIVDNVIAVYEKSMDLEF